MHASSNTEMTSCSFFDKQSLGAVPFTRSFYLLVTVFTTATLTRYEWRQHCRDENCDNPHFITNELFKFLIAYSKRTFKMMNSGAYFIVIVLLVA